MSSMDVQDSSCHRSVSQPAQGCLDAWEAVTTITSVTWGFQGPAHICHTSNAKAHSDVSWGKRETLLEVTLHAEF